MNDGSMVALWFDTLKAGSAQAMLETSNRVGGNALSLFGPLAGIFLLLMIAGILWGSIALANGTAVRGLVKIAAVAALLSPNGPYNQVATMAMNTPDGMAKMAAPRVAQRGIPSMIDESQRHTQELAQAFRDQDKSTFPISISRAGWEFAATSVHFFGAAQDAVAIILFSLGMVGLGALLSFGKFLSLGALFGWSRQMFAQFVAQTFGYWMLFGMVSATYGILFSLQANVKAWAIANAVSGWGAAMWIILFSLVNLGLLMVVGMKSQHLAGGIQITTMGALTSASRMARNATSRLAGGAGKLRPTSVRRSWRRLQRDGRMVRDAGARLAARLAGRRPDALRQRPQ